MLRPRLEAKSCLLQILLLALLQKTILLRPLALSTFYTEPSEILAWRLLCNRCVLRHHRRVATTIACSAWASARLQQLQSRIADYRCHMWPPRYMHLDLSGSGRLAYDPIRGRGMAAAESFCFFQAFLMLQCPQHHPLNDAFSCLHPKVESSQMLRKKLVTAAYLLYCTSVTSKHSRPNMQRGHSRHYTLGFNLKIDTDVSPSGAHFTCVLKGLATTLTGCRHVRWGSSQIWIRKGRKVLCRSCNSCHKPTLEAALHSTHLVSRALDETA